MPIKEAKSKDSKAAQSYKEENLTDLDRLIGKCDEGDLEEDSKLRVLLRDYFQSCERNSSGTGSRALVLKSLKANRVGDAAFLKALYLEGKKGSFGGKFTESLALYAAKTGCVETLQIVLESEGRLNFNDEKGFSLLQLAAYNCQPGAIKFLLESGFDVNDKNGKGSSPLHLALSSPADGATEAIHCLIENGANVNDANGKGVASWFMASRRSRDPEALSIVPGVSSARFDLRALEGLLSSPKFDVCKCFEGGENLFFCAVEDAIFDGDLRTLNLILKLRPDFDLMKLQIRAPLRYSGKTVQSSVFDCIAYLGNITKKRLLKTDQKQRLLKNCSCALGLLFNYGKNISVQDHDKMVEIFAQRDLCELIQLLMFQNDMPEREFYEDMGGALAKFGKKSFYSQGVRESILETFDQIKKVRTLARQDATRDMEKGELDDIVVSMSVKIGGIDLIKDIVKVYPELVNNTELEAEGLKLFLMGLALQSDRTDVVNFLCNECNTKFNPNSAAALTMARQFIVSLDLDTAILDLSNDAQSLEKLVDLGFDVDTIIDERQGLTILNLITLQFITLEKESNTEKPSKKETWKRQTLIGKQKILLNMVQNLLNRGANIDFAFDSNGELLLDLKEFKMEAKLCRMLKEERNRRQQHQGSTTSLANTMLQTERPEDLKVKASASSNSKSSLPPNETQERKERGDIASDGKASIDANQGEILYWPMVKELLTTIEQHAQTSSANSDEAKELRRLCIERITQIITETKGGSEDIIAKLEQEAKNSDFVMGIFDELSQTHTKKGQRATFGKREKKDRQKEISSEEFEKRKKLADQAYSDLMEEEISKKQRQQAAAIKKSARLKRKRMQQEAIEKELREKEEELQRQQEHLAAKKLQAIGRGFLARQNFLQLRNQETDAPQSTNKTKRKKRRRVRTRHGKVNNVETQSAVKLDKETSPLSNSGNLTLVKAPSSFAPEEPSNVMANNMGFTFLTPPTDATSAASYHGDIAVTGKSESGFVETTSEPEKFKREALSMAGEGWQGEIEANSSIDTAPQDDATVFTAGTSEEMELVNSLESAARSSREALEKIINKLFDLGTHLKDEYVGKMLYYIVAANDVKSAKRVLRENSHGDLQYCQKSGYSALHGCCCCLGDGEMLQVLLNSKRFDIELKSHNGTTPLKAAAAFGCLDNMKILIENGAAISCAIYDECIELARDICDEESRASVISNLEEDKANFQGAVNATLHMKIKSHANEDAKELIASGADLSKLDQEGNCLAITALLCNNRDMLDLLFALEGGIDVRVKNNHGYSILTYALKERDKDTCLELLKRGADILDIDAQIIKIAWPTMGGLLGPHLNKLLLDEFTKPKPDHENIQALLERGADINMKLGKDEESLLYYAVSQNLVAMAQTLLKLGADVNLKSGRQDEPALHLATKMRLFFFKDKDGQKATLSLEMIGELLKYGADANCKIVNLGQYPLHQIACSNDVACASLLLKNGADCTLTDDQGRTAQVLFLTRFAEEGLGEMNLLLSRSLIEKFEEKKRTETQTQKDIFTMDDEVQNFEAPDTPLNRTEFKKLPTTTSPVHGKKYKDFAVPGNSPNATQEAQRNSGIATAVTENPSDVTRKTGAFKVPGNSGNPTQETSTRDKKKKPVLVNMPGNWRKRQKERTKTNNTGQPGAQNLAKKKESVRRN